MNGILLRKDQLALLAVFLLTLGIAGSPASYAQSSATSTVPVIDGTLGSCSADFTVTDAAGSPVYNAKIKVHIAYRFLSLHKLDLEISTNSDGKARFTGLPNRVKRPLFFDASQADQEGSASLDPSANCTAQLTIALHKNTP